MSLRAVRLRNLLLLVAVFATIVVAGCWDNRRNMQHILADGYPVLVEITGAQRQRLAPFALDGWRPRFVEQSLSVDLKWDGRDGKPHVFKKVPVTDGFARTIVSGEQVKLAILPAKVLDDPHAVPVINADAVPRFTSLQEWIRYSAFLAMAAWLGFGVSTIFVARSGSAAAGTGAPHAEAASAFPLRRTLFGFSALLVGAALTFQAWSVQDATSSAAPGIEATAEITSASTAPAAGGQTSHVIQLSWKDAQGGVHHFGPVHVSDNFWNKITRNGELAVHQTRIRYGGQGADARPVLLDDSAAKSWRVEFALGFGLFLMAVGAGCLFSAARVARDQTRHVGRRKA